jgi:hypothetical protein
VDVDPVPGGDAGSCPAGPGRDTVPSALCAADAAARMAVRSHPVVPAAILSGLAVRSVEIAALVNVGRYGDLNRPLIRALADGLERDLGRARRYAVARHLRLGSAVSHRRVSARVLGQSPRGWSSTPAQSVACGFAVAAHLAGELVEAIDGILADHLDRRLTFSRDEDLEMALELAGNVGSTLSRARALAEGLGERPLPGQVRRTGRTISRALGPAAERVRTMDRVCVQGLAARLGITTTDGLAQALTDGALDDFTSADLTRASLAPADLTGVRWSLTGTAWPPGTDIKALLARSEIHPGDVLVLRHRGMMWQPSW